MLAQSVLSLGLGFVAVPGGWACGLNPQGAGEPQKGGHPARGFWQDEHHPWKLEARPSSHLWEDGVREELGGEQGSTPKEASLELSVWAPQGKGSRQRGSF